MSEKLGERVRLARELREMSQHELARKVWIAQPSLCAIEIGQAKKTKHLLALSRALRVRPEWLQFGTGQMEVSLERTEKEARLLQAASGMTDEGLDKLIALAEHFAGMVNT